MVRRALRMISLAKNVGQRNFSSTTGRLCEHTFQYRSAPERQGKVTIGMGNVSATVMWWWIFYKLITEPGHVFGEFDYPDASKWTDEELGIPPDTED